MQLIKKRGLYEASKIVYLPVNEISANPDQPRRRMNPTEMRELAESISKYGVLQPLSVRRLGSGYELLSGERRMRAAMLCGLKEVPCIIMDVNTRESAVLMLVENILRRDLDFIEEARGLSRLVNIYGYSQEEVARLVGLSQPAVANKIRLLKIPADLLFIVREAGLTERHARALLRLETQADMISVLDKVISNEYNVAKTESYIDEFIAQKTAPTQIAAPEPVVSEPPAPPPVVVTPPKKAVFILRDARLLVNSVTRGVNLLQQSGINATLNQVENDDELVLTIRIPK